MSAGPPDPGRARVQEAAAAALGRPLAWVLGLLTLGALAGSSVVVALLGGAVAYLGVVVGTLLAGGPELPGAPAPALPPEDREGRARPLPEDLRGRYRALHGRVEALLASVPEEVRATRFDPEALAATPEAFRAVARSLSGLDPGDPGRAPLEERLGRLEGAVARLQERWSLLGAGEAMVDVESLEEAADELEALAELEILALPPGRGEGSG